MKLKVSIGQQYLMLEFQTQNKIRMIISLKLDLIYFNGHKLNYKIKKQQKYVGLLSHLVLILLHWLEIQNNKIEKNKLKNHGNKKNLEELKKLKKPEENS
jgi:hypothetical protein